ATFWGRHRRELSSLPRTARASTAMRALVLSLCCALPGAALGATANVSVDPGADRHPIDDRIHGVNFAEPSAGIPFPLNRWGGNAVTRYSWEDDAGNRGSDWFFASYPSDNDH